jgi:SAM-dependent methyltransferase
MVNAGQIEAWDGPMGERWVAQVERHDRMGTGFTERLLELLAAQEGERILEVGCGGAGITLALGQRVGQRGSIVGLDVSGPMLAEARRRAALQGATNVTFEKGDAQVYPFAPASFDAAVSRFGVMFFDDPVAAFANIGQTLEPGGRLVFCCWQELAHNDWIMVPAGAALQYVPMPDLGQPGAPGPFSLADPERIRTILADSSWVDIGLEEVVCPMHLGDSVDDAMDYLEQSEIAEALTRDVEPATVARGWAAVKETLEARATTDGINLNGLGWLVSAKRPS